MKGWNITQLSQIAAVTDSLHKTPKYSDHGHSMVRVTDVIQGFLKTSNCLKVSDEVFDEFSKNHTPQKGDIVFSRVGSEGRTSLVVEDANFCLGQNTAFISPQNENYFLYYWLNSSVGRAQIKKKTTGASQRTISLKSIRELEISIPSIGAQEKLSDLISRYDYLIQNNQKRIKILEEMAQRLYTEWFVNFKFPGHEDVKLVDSGSKFGMIPEGWEVRKLKELGEVVTGKTPSKKKKSNYGNKYPFIKTPDFHGNAYILTSNEMLSEEGANTQFKKILPPNAVIVSTIGTLGKVAITSQPSFTNQQINSLVLGNKDDFIYYYYFAKSLKSKLKGLGATGATMGNVSKGKFANIEILYPKESVRKGYFRLAESNFKEIRNLEQRNKDLAKMRDLLIENLVTGKRLLKN